MSHLRISFWATVAFVAVALVSLLAVTGCGGSSKASTTITFWQGYTDIERTAIDQAVADYNATNPGFKVQAVFSGNNDYALQKLLTALAAGKAPDITYQYGSSMANLVRSPKVVDLTSRVNEPSFDWNDFFPAERLAATVDGKVVGVPALVDNLALSTTRRSSTRPACVPDGAVDLGRLPRRRQEAHECGDEAVRLGVCQRRQ